VASTCSPPPALDSICWGSGDGGSGSITSSFPGCSSCALSASGCPTGGSGAGVAEIGSGSSKPKADEVLTTQNQIYYQTNQKNTRYIMNKELHSQRGFLHAGLLKSQKSFTPMVLIAGGGVTPAEGAGCPGEVPATAMVTTPVEAVDGSVPAFCIEPPAGTSSPANAVPTTFRRLGSGGGEEEGLQHR
jgi:hypothetical protein